jgi:hypothetical protein
MLSYDGENEDATTKRKVDNVKEHVKNVLDVIQENKKKQLNEQALRADMAVETAFENRLSSHSSRSASSRRSEFRHLSAEVPFGSPDVETFASAFPAPPKDKQRLSSVLARSALTPVAAEVALHCGSIEMSAEMVKDASDFPDFPEEQPLAGRSGEFTASNSSCSDFTSVPKLLDMAIEKYDTSSALRSTTIKTAEVWFRERQENLLTKPKVHTLHSDVIKSEKNKAFDLLDALSRSGSLSLPYSELHVIVCVTHCFEKNVMETVIQDNVNPIEKLEWSTLLLASIVHGVPASTLISNNDRTRLAASFPHSYNLKMTKSIKEMSTFDHCISPPSNIDSHLLPLTSTVI